MIVQFSRRLGVVLAALAGLSGAAYAQSPACNAWRSELASLQNQRGDARAAQAAQRVGAQLAQATNQYRSMGCERGGFLFFGEAPPPQCGGLRAQIGQLQNQYGALQRQAAGGGSEQRRAQLMAAIENNCRPQQRGFFDTIFGLEPRRGEVETTMPELEPEEPLSDEPQKPRMGGPYSVCVRTCDGYFFPLANTPGGGSQDEMCQALCPGTETLAFGMQSGGDIQNAVARSTGTPYSSLLNAGKYTRTFDAACACKPQGQSWAQTLKEAEYLLDKRKGDVIVTQQRADELSRPRVADPKRTDPRRRGAPVPAAIQPAVAPDQPEEKPMPSENSPTSGTESAGVGPETVGERVLDKGDGLKRETRSVTGERRTVRIVAPNLAPNLGPSAIRN